jgi:hypothetical protein
MITELIACSHCKDTFTDDKLTEISTGVYVCNPCWLSASDDCETCGSYIAGGNPFSRYCDTCLDARQRTNETVEPNYYRIKFAYLPYDTWEYGNTAKEAIQLARQNFEEYGKYLGNATARQAVYKEWNNETWQYTNGGNFIRRDRTVA